MCHCCHQLVKLTLYGTHCSHEQPWLIMHQAHDDYFNENAWEWKSVSLQRQTTKYLEVWKQDDGKFQDEKFQPRETEWKKVIMWPELWVYMAAKTLPACTVADVFQLLFSWCYNYSPFQFLALVWHQWDSEQVQPLTSFHSCEWSVSLWGLRIGSRPALM